MAALEFAAYGVTHAVDQGEVVGEVGDDGGDVGQGGHAGEGGPALEVGEDEVEGLGGVGDRQAQDEGAQELGFTGTGRADAQAVRAHAVLRGLLEVEHDGLPGFVDTDRDAQAFGLGAGTPGAGDLDVGGVAEVEEIGEVQVGQERLVLVPCRPHTGARAVGRGCRRVPGRAGRGVPL